MDFKKEVPLDVFEKILMNKIKNLLKNEFWKSPSELSNIIRDIISSYSIYPDIENVIVTGENNNVSVYILRNNDVILYAPFQNLDKNIIMEINPNILDKKNNVMCILKKSQTLIDRLTLPKVYLINPSIKDIFPVPRLAISVSSLAGYLRKLQKAEVHIRDMQINSSLDDILTEIKNIQPAIIGISISFGQATLAENILDKIYSDPIIMSHKPIIVIGNVISSFGYKKWIKKYPDLIICRSEGERSIVDLVEYTNGLKKINEVSGIYYFDGGVIKSTEVKDLDMDEIPLPSMDTAPKIIEKNGVLTMETSRGCFHSACSFCPRTHKPKKWKGMSPDNVIRQLRKYAQIFNKFEVKRRIFMADEEFIGWMESGDEAKRIIEICNKIIEGDLRINFETNTRVDQIYNPKKDKKWHIERMNMIKLCEEAGLERLLLGIESGSNSVLRRFNKGIQKTDSILAIRILTALGVGIRPTFILFDPLMNFNELKENIKFLERNDVCLNKISTLSISMSELYDGINDTNFINKYSMDSPLYENIAYMLVSLEVLMNCNYVNLLREANNNLNKTLLINDDKMDLNMARYNVMYLNDKIGDISNFCQRWIDRHFALDYCLKGMYKTADEIMRELIFKYRAKYRGLSFNLLKTMVYIFDEDDEIHISELIIDNKTLLSLKNRLNYENRKIVLMDILEIFNKKLEHNVKELTQLIDEGVIDDENDNLLNVIHNWKCAIGWELINP